MDDVGEEAGPLTVAAQFGAQYAIIGQTGPIRNLQLHGPAVAIEGRHIFVEGELPRRCELASAPFHEAEIPGDA